MKTTYRVYQTHIRGCILQTRYLINGYMIINRDVCIAFVLFGVLIFDLSLMITKERFYNFSEIRHIA